MVKQKKNLKKDSDFNKDVALAKKKAKEGFLDAKKKILKAEKDVERFIEKNPKKAVAIAVGVGAAIGAVVEGMMKRKK